MKFFALKENLAWVLAAVSGMAGKSSQLPILQNVLIKAADQGVDLITTNLEMAVLARLRSKVEASGSYTVPVRLLNDVVGLFPGERLEVKGQANELVLQGENTTSRLRGMPPEEFPVLPQFEGGKIFTLKNQDLTHGLGAVLPAVARTEVRPELAAVLFNFYPSSTPNLVLAATDSYRLAEKTLPLVKGEDPLVALIPLRSAQELYRLLALAAATAEEPVVEVSANANQLRVVAGPVQFITRLVVGQYPDYQQIIPTIFKTTIKLPISALSSEVKAAGLFSVGGVASVSLSATAAEQTLSLTTSSAQTGDYHSSLKGEVVGEDNQVLLNYHYLLDGLSHLSGKTAVLQLNSPESPCLLTGAGDTQYRYLIMPVRQ